MRWATTRTATRGVLTMRSIIYHVGPKSFVGRLMSVYARVYLLFAASVQRRQEIEADNAAARLAGARSLATALHELHGIEALWNVYLEDYVGSRWWGDIAPDRVAGAFPALVAARPEVRFNTRPVDVPASRWDSHPSTAERVAYLSALAVPQVPVDDRAAAVLLPNLDAVTVRMDNFVFSRHNHRLVPWPEYTARSAAVRAQQAAAQALAEFARLAGVPAVTAATVLDAVGSPLLDRVAGTSRRHPDAVALLITTIVADAAVRSGLAWWRHSWSGPAQLVLSNGAVVDVEALGRRLADPRTAHAARGELAAIGVRLDGAVAAAPKTFGGAEVLGLAVNLVVNDDRRDVIVYDRGFLVVPGASRTKMYAAAERLEEISGHPLPALVQNPEFRFLPFDEVAQCVRTKASVTGRALVLTGGLRTASNGQAFAFDLTMRDGSRVSVRWGMETQFIEDTYDVIENCVDVLESRS
jgi:hypothetical protein